MMRLWAEYEYKEKPLVLSIEKDKNADIHKLRLRLCKFNQKVRERSMAGVNRLHAWETPNTLER